MDPYYFYYLDKFVIVDFVGKTANSIRYSMLDIETLNYYSKENLKHLFKNFKHNILELDIGVHPVSDHLQIEMKFLTTFNSNGSILFLLLK